MNNHYSLIFRKNISFCIFLILIKYCITLTNIRAEEVYQTDQKEQFLIDNAITNIESAFAFLIPHIDFLHELMARLRKDKIVYLSLGEGGSKKEDTLHIVKSFIAGKRYHTSWMIDLSQNIEQEFQYFAKKINYKPSSKKTASTDSQFVKILEYFAKSDPVGILVINNVNSSNFANFQIIQQTLQNTTVDLICLMEGNYFCEMDHLPNKLQSDTDQKKHLGHDVKSIIKNFLITRQQYFADYLSQQFSYEPYIATIAAQYLNRSYTMKMEQYMNLSDVPISYSAKIKNIINNSTRHLRRSSVDLLQRLSMIGILDFSFHTAEILLGQNPIFELLDLTHMNFIYCTHYNKEASIYRIENAVSKYVMLDERVSYSLVYKKILETIVEYQSNTCNNCYEEITDFINSPSLENLLMNIIKEEKFNKRFFNELYKIVIASSLLNLYVETDNKSKAEYLAGFLLNKKLFNAKYYKILPINLLKDCYLNYMYSLGKYYLKMQKNYVVSIQFLKAADMFVQNLQDQRFCAKKILTKSLLMQNQILLNISSLEKIEVDHKLIQEIESIFLEEAFVRAEVLYTKALYQIYTKNLQNAHETINELSKILSQYEYLKMTSFGDSVENLSRNIV